MTLYVLVTSYRQACTHCAKNRKLLHIMKRTLMNRRELLTFSSPPLPSPLPCSHPPYVSRITVSPLGTCKLQHLTDFMSRLYLFHRRYIKMKRESEKKAGKACVAYILAFDRKYVPPTVLVFGSCRAREREAGGEERENDRQRKRVRACMRERMCNFDR